MSYSFGMFFKQMNDADEVITFVGQIMKLARENAKEMIESGRYYRPSNRCCDFNVKTSKEKEMDVYFKRELDKRWLYSLFNFHFVYWKDFHLLGLSGYSFCKDIDGLFDCHVTFQNGTDQDYEYETWNDKISIFKQIKESVATLTVDDILSAYEAGKKDWHTKEEIEKSFEYHAKSYLYELIYDKTLDLDSWLYCEDGKFQRLTVNAIDNLESWFELECVLKIAKNE